MLSGTGRHRRPRQAPALLVAAGVTGSAIAIPFLGATGASAASGTTWDQVAECESGGSWSADTGNGRYGGLQMTQENWESYGGLDYATSPDQASRSQQIAVAEKILADQGVGVWSTCGLLHNLGGDSGTADVDTGVADDSSNSGDSSSSTESTKSAESPETPDSSRSADSSNSSETSDSSPDAAEGSIKADVDSNDSKNSGESAESGDSVESGDSGSDVSQGSDSSSADDAGSGRHRGASADESADDNARTESSSSSSSPSGRHASRGGEAARETVDAVHASYTVREGDSLTSIADSLALQGGWRELYAENEGTVGTDPDLILPGQTLEVGVETGEK
ncbi:LysM peptidoglycan-binding domain-containing protein [Streptomyces capitiformicae]|nr:transglycosylase family protein [Streptomyces capitiformicae]